MEISFEHGVGGSPEVSVSGGGLVHVVGVAGVGRGFFADEAGVRHRVPRV
jgi:hypothetical protein